MHCESSREPCGFYRGTVIRAETGLGLENGCITSPVVLETGDSQHFNQLNEKVKVFSLFIVKKMSMINSKMCFLDYGFRVVLRGF